MSADSTHISLHDLQQLTDEVPVMLACYDAHTMRCLYANARYAAIGNMSPQQAIGRGFEEIIGAESAGRVQQAVDCVLRDRTSVAYSRELSVVDGSPRWIEVCLIPSGGPEVERIFVLVTDITKRRAAALENRQISDRLARFMAATMEGIAFHVGGTITDVNPPLLKMLGYTQSEMVGHSTLEFIPERERLRVRHVLASGSEMAYESAAVCKDGRVLPVEYCVRNFEWFGKPQRLIIVRDLSERRAAEERIRYLALHDVLTGLPNRAQLDDRLNSAITAANSGNTHFSVYFVDLDQLKRVNDSLGHSFGDVLLSGVGERLSAFCRRTSSAVEKPWLARLGGDEFVIVAANANFAAREQFSNALQAALQRPIEVHGRKIKITASIGVATYPVDGDTPSRLLKNADVAMYAAKASGRDATRFFDQSLADAADQALVIEQELEQAIQNNEFELYFQPEVSPDGQHILAAEALIRWRHPTRGLVGPDEFIAVAESLYLIVPIGQWVIDAALAQVPYWRQLGWKDARVSVNLSHNQLRAPGFADNVLRSLAAAGLTGDCLELEVTERMLMTEDTALAVSLNTLRQASITLAIDDFGTGFSSLSRLRTLPIEKLKIDKSFIVDLPHIHSVGAIVNSILELAQGLGLTAVAEGVETEQQRECLESLGCRAMQGYFFARPMPGDAFCGWLQANLAAGQHATQA